MPNKYYDMMSKINADEKFKENLISNLENMEVNDMKNEKTGIIIKIRKAIITIVSVLTLLVGGGVVYATLGGTINGVPVLEWAGIKFSDKYVEYAEQVENQVLGDENVKVTLEATAGDYGFSILQFRVNISESLANEHRTISDGTNINYLSFNDKLGSSGYPILGGSNYNLIIDGEDVWVRGKSQQSVEKICDTEFLVYQMYFLDDKILNGNENYTITLEEVILGIGEECIKLDGKFEVEMSKEKATKDTTTIIPSEDTVIKYKKMEKSIEAIYLTPLQNIVKVKTIFKDVDTDDITYTLDEDFVDMIEYVTFYNESRILSHMIPMESKITYDDGTVEELEWGDFGFSKNFKNATYESVEMIAIEQNEKFDEIALRFYERNDRNDTIKRLGEYKINLNTNQISKNDKQMLIYDKKTSNMTKEYLEYYKNFHGGAELENYTEDIYSETSNESEKGVNNSIPGDSELGKILSNVNKINTVEELEELLKATTMANIGYVKVNSIEKKEDAYLVKASLLKPVVLDKIGYDMLVNDGSIEIDNKIYTYQKDDGGRYSGTLKSDYGFVVSEDNKLYMIEPCEGGYIMHLGIGGVSWSVDINEGNFELYLDGKTTVTEINSFESVELEKYYSKFNNELMENNKVRMEYYPEGIEITVDVR